MTALPWLEVDMEGLRATLERKGKAWAIYELVQNAWDENGTEVAITRCRAVRNCFSNEQS